MLLFCAKTIVKESRRFELARLKKKKKEKKKGPSGEFLVRYFRNAFSATGVLFVTKTLEDER